MSDEEPTVAVPVSLIEDAADLANTSGTDEMRDALRALLPKPTPRRFRVVELDDKGYDYRFEDVESAPDVMAIVEQAVNYWWRNRSPLEGRVDLIDCIRAAIEEAVG